MRLTKGRLNTLSLTEKRLKRQVPRHLLPAFFEKTDRGVNIVFDNSRDKMEFAEVMGAFKQIALDYNMWVEDFRKGLLLPEDFGTEDDATKTLALKAFLQATGIEDINCLPGQAKWFLQGYDVYPFGNRKGLLSPQESSKESIV